MINDSQWQQYEAKYGGLIHTISKKISGDNMVASYEDNRSDLQVAAIESIIAYEKKTGQSFDEAFGTELFDKYTKTVLWNRKAKKGIPLTKKMDFRKKHKAIYNKEGIPYVIEDPKYASGVPEDIVDKLFPDSDENVRKVLDAILSDPSVVTHDGKLKGYSLTKPTGLSIHFVRRAVDSIKRTLVREYGE